MSLAIISLIIVCFGFGAIVCYVFAPRNRGYFAEMSEIPLGDEENSTVDTSDGDAT